VNNTFRDTLHCAVSYGLFFFLSLRTSRRIQQPVLGNLQPVFFFWIETPSFIFTFNEESYTSLYIHFILLISTKKHSGPNASRHCLSTLNFKIVGLL
jgi:hypothetical protein